MSDSKQQYGADLTPVVMFVSLTLIAILYIGWLLITGWLL